MKIIQQEAIVRENGKSAKMSGNILSKQHSTGFKNGVRRIFENELKSIYRAEKESMQILPWLIEEVNSEELKGVLQYDLAVKKEQHKRLSAIFETIALPLLGKNCETINGLLRDTEIMLNEIAEEENEVRDAAIIAAVQRIQGFELASYSTLCILSNALKMEDISLLLESTLKEEREVYDKLTEITETTLALQASHY